MYQLCPHFFTVNGITYVIYRVLMWQVKKLRWARMDGRLKLLPLKSFRDEIATGIQKTKFQGKKIVCIPI